MKRVLVVFGGCSTEYEVSLQSAAAVMRAIDRNLYEVVHLGITKDGRAFIMKALRKRLWKVPGRRKAAFQRPFP